VAAVVEGLLAQGLEQAVGADIDRLTRAGQRARLADLRLLARLAAAAAGGLRALTGRADDTTASAVLSALAQAWACAQAVSSGTVAAAGEAAALPQRLIPLAARWGHAPSGTRSFTLHAWDPDARRLEQAANGRAAGADPGFVRSWDAPLLWKASAARLCSGMLTVHNPSRRDDGSLAASSGTAVTAGGWDGVDLAELAGQVNSADNGLARTQFGAGSEPLRILLPKRSFGLGALELDEIAQELVWPVTDRTGQTHRLALPADEVNAQLLTWLVQESKLTAITSVGGRPEAVFLLDKKGLRLVSLTLTPLPLRQLEPKWRRRLLGLDRQRRAAGPEPEPDRLRRLCAALGDLVDDLAASGQHSLGPHHLDTLTRRAQELDDLGLATPAAAAVALLDQVTPARLLWAKLIFDRVTVLLG
jgi:hypothetical protein